MKTGKLSALLLGAAFAVGSFSSCSRSGAAEGQQNNYNLIGNGSGSMVVPANTGTGTSTFTGTYNPNSNVLSYNINYSGLTGVPSSGGFFQGAAGQVGPQLGNTFTFTGTTGTGSVMGTQTLTASQETMLMNGQYYYSLGTAAYPTGEVRGQVTIQ